MPKYELENINRFTVNILENKTLSADEKVEILLKTAKEMLEKTDN